MRIRQPIGGDFSFSNGLLQIFNKDTWWDNYPSINKFGIDIWMTTIALNEGFKVCQTMLGAKIHDDKDPGSHLADMYIQVVGTMFELIKYYEFHWKKVENSVQGEMFGKHKFFEIEKIDINTSELWNIFNKGLDKYRQVWKNIFTANTFNEFEKVADTIPSKNIHLSVELWARIVFEYASLYNFIDKSQKNALLISMLPLYFLRTASFIREAEHLNYEIADAIVEGDAGVFERLKYCFTDQWEYYKSKKEIISIDGLIE